LPYGLWYHENGKGQTMELNERILEAAILSELERDQVPLLLQ
jgi:hypothetical protein